MMSFTLQREDLLDPLQAVCTAIEKKQTLPILSNILLSLEGNQLSLTATDLEVELVAHTQVEKSSEDGSITLPARKLMDIFKNLPDHCVCQFSQKEGRMILKAGQSRFTLSMLPADEYPHIDTGDITSEVEISETNLRQLLEKTQFAMAQQDVRYYLNGILLDINQDIIKSVATDGHRLAMSSIQTGSQSTPLKIIVPRKGIIELIRLLKHEDKPIKLHVGSNFIRVLLPHISFTSKLIEGRFPDYTRVIPKNGNKVLKANKESLKHALGRAAILSHDKHRGIRAEISEKVKKIFAVNAENEQAEEELDIEFSGNEGLEIGLNVNYLQDVLSVLDSNTVKMTFTDADSSILVESDNPDDASLYVIMPMRL